MYLLKHACFGSCSRRNISSVWKSVSLQDFYQSSLNFSEVLTSVCVSSFLYQFKKIYSEDEGDDGQEYIWKSKTFFLYIYIYKNKFCEKESGSFKKLAKLKKKKINLSLKNQDQNQRNPKTKHESSEEIRYFITKFSNNHLLEGIDEMELESEPSDLCPGLPVELLISQIIQKPGNDL